MADDLPDLTPVLTRLMAHQPRAKETTKKRRANHPETRGLLDAGLRLIAEELQVDAIRPRDGETGRPFFKWMTMKSVLEEAGLTEGKFRDRWLTLGDYHEDLLAYVLWTHHWASHMDVVQQAETTLAGGDLAEAIKLVAYEDLKVMLSGAAQRISLISTGIAAQDQEGEARLSSLYAMARDAWSAVYERTLNERGLRLRPGIELDELTNILTSLIDGITIRALGDPETKVIDHETKETLLGKAVMMIAIAAIDPGDGMTLEEVIRQIDS